MFDWSFENIIYESIHKPSETLWITSYRVWILQFKKELKAVCKVHDMKQRLRNSTDSMLPLPEHQIRHLITRGYQQAWLESKGFLSQCACVYRLLLSRNSPYCMHAFRVARKSRCSPSHHLHLLIPFFFFFLPFLEPLLLVLVFALHALFLLPQLSFPFRSPSSTSSFSTISLFWSPSSSLFWFPSSSSLFWFPSFSLFWFPSSSLSSSSGSSGSSGSSMPPR